MDIKKRVDPLIFRIVLDKIKQAKEKYKSGELDGAYEIVSECNILLAKYKHRIGSSKFFIYTIEEIK